MLNQKVTEEELRCQQEDVKWKEFLMEVKKIILLQIITINKIKIFKLKIINNKNKSI